jgi:hypothetical protein
MSRVPVAPGSEIPYAALSALFWAGLLTAARAGRERLGEPTSAVDLLALGLAGAKLGTIVAEDRVTLFLRRPFTEGPAAVQPAGDGLRRALGELITCPHCVALWATGALAAAQLARPRETRLVARVFAGLAIADAALSRVR